MTASAATATELSSANFRHVGGSVASSSAAGAGALVAASPNPEIASSSASVGGTPSAAPAGSEITLASLMPGFWSIVAGGFAALDIDGDLAQFFLDEDDDGDGLEDAFETGTGFFVSSTNTGTSPVLADSDGDGFQDGAEVGAGSDPNDSMSTPNTPPVPALHPGIVLLLLATLMSLGAWALRRSFRRSAC